MGPFAPLAPQGPSSSNLDTVLVIVLNNLPVPNEQTPWEQVFEYHKDPDSSSKFLALRKWMRDVSKSNLPRHEIDEKLEYLLNEYQQHMKLHKMKTNAITLETLVVTPIELLENLIKIKWSEVAKKLFSLVIPKQTGLRND